MEKQEFVALMPYISADLVYTIVKRRGISEEAAIMKLYASKLYEKLEDEGTKLWQYSTPMLYSLLEYEEQTGELHFPDV